MYVSHLLSFRVYSSSLQSHHVHLILAVPRLQVLNILSQLGCIIIVDGSLCLLFQLLAPSMSKYSAVWKPYTLIPPLLLLLMWYMPLYLYAL